MGRTKQFDEQRVLEQAMHLFWEHGYERTTYALLEQETGISARSLINAFGDKHELFLRALDCYHHRQQSAFQACLHGAGINGIKRFFAGFAGVGVDDPRRFGCLMVNTITSPSAQLAGIDEKALAFRSMFLQSFREALARDGVPDAAHKAQFLVSLLWGLGVELKLGGANTRVQGLVGCARRTLESWRPSARGGNG